MSAVQSPMRLASIPIFVSCPAVVEMYPSDE
jgi:hypothetical protein